MRLVGNPFITVKRWHFVSTNPISVNQQTTRLPAPSSLLAGLTQALPRSFHPCPGPQEGHQQGTQAARHGHGWSNPCGAQPSASVTQAVPVPARALPLLAARPRTSLHLSEGLFLK